LCARAHHPTELLPVCLSANDGVCGNPPFPHGCVCFCCRGRRLTRLQFLDACRAGDAAAVRRALTCGEDVEAADDTGNTGLHLAAVNDRAEVWRLSFWVIVPSLHGVLGVVGCGRRVYEATLGLHLAGGRERSD
jgi:hypothetical protein